MKKYFFVFLFCTFLVAWSRSQTILREADIENAYPRLSADGKQLLYQSNRSGNWQLYIRNIDGGKEERIPNDKFQNNFPDWSPDNKWIAFVSDRDGNEEIYIMRSDGTGLKRLTDDKGRDIHPYFSPDGKTLLFNSTRDKEAFDIFSMNLENGEITRVTDTPDDETCARYSADMRYIVFLRNNASSDDVFISDVKSGVTSNLTRTPRSTDGWPMWSSDGHWVYYSALTAGRYSIFRIKPDGTSKEQLTQAGEGEEHARVCVSQKADFIIYNVQKGKTISIERKILN
jgi:tol-pal system beta propeller repeat protein TolB